MSEVDHTPQPCHHKIADHQHGTRACYVWDKCRCWPCINANREDREQRERAQLYGTYDKHVDVEPVREHILLLSEAGMGTRTIEKRAGVSRSTIQRILGLGGRKPYKRVLRETAEKLKALDPTSPALAMLAGGSILNPDDSVRARHQLRALVALGWSMAEIGRRLDIDNICPMISENNRCFLVSHARRAQALYDELSMTMPPETNVASRCRNYARERGWLRPLELSELDDDGWAELEDSESDNDLDEVAIQRRMHGDRRVKLTKAEARELVHRWARSDRSLNECQRRTGIKPDRYYRIKDQPADETAS